MSLISGTRTRTHESRSCEQAVISVSTLARVASFASSILSIPAKCAASKIRILESHVSYTNVNPHGLSHYSLQ